MLLNYANASTNAVYQLPKILIIEDDQAISEVLQQFFKMTGYPCLTRASALDIVALVNELQPSLIIMDYLLPQINGGDLCSRIKSETEFRNIPVIICSAYPRVLMSLGDYGSDAFITKPFDLDDLMTTVELLLHKSATREKTFSNCH